MRRITPGCLGEEGVPQVARRMMLGDVEQLEVVLLALHLGRAVHLEAHLGEDAVHLAQRLRGDVQPPARRPPPGQGHVQALGGQLILQVGRLDPGFAFRQGRFQSQLDLVGLLAHRAALLLGDLAHARENLHHRRAAAQVCAAPGLHGLLVLNALQRLQAGLLKSGPVHLVR